ncbi:hypothetical protein C8J57DRAFT_1240625 [Mycena rebaudengoi]|nr:hypothetical protein C8J57DRAFT_1240625 [Mycena rebaudengoi]
MGLSQKSKVQDAANVRSFKKGGGYVKDKETKGDVLRPDWSSTFPENSSWHNKMIVYAHQKAPQTNPIVTTTIMAAKTDDEILEPLSVVFKGIAAAYRKAQKCHADSGNSGADHEDGVGEEDAKQRSRRSQRKIRKSEERIATLQEAHIDIPEGFEYTLNPQYQSMDESDQSDVVDPHTDTETKDEPHAVSMHKPWKTFSPYYRSETYNTRMDEIEQLVLEHRRCYEKNNKGKTTAHPRDCAGWKDTPLPFIKKGPKIPWSAIDPEWLAVHSDQDTPSRIREDGEMEVEDNTMDIENDTMDKED